MNKEDFYSNLKEIRHFWLDEYSIFPRSFKYNLLSKNRINVQRNYLCFHGTDHKHSFLNLIFNPIKFLLDSWKPTVSHSFKKHLFFKTKYNSNKWIQWKHHFILKIILRYWCWYTPFVVSYSDAIFGLLVLKNFYFSLY